MKKLHLRRLAWGLSLMVGASLALAEEVPLPTHQLPAAKRGGMVIGNCDGKTSVEVASPDGQPLAPAQAQDVADKLMQQWRALHPKADWVIAENGSGGKVRDASVRGSSGKSSAASEARGSTGLGTADPETKVQSKASGTREKEKSVTEQDGAYGNFSDADKAMWNAETEKFVHRGDELFHDGSKLGGRTGMACAMCHPNASNTHPETYPKFQVQLGRVALLRDMINWCLENPIKAKALKDDDPNLRALQAYILAQRKGTPMDYGKH